MPLILKDEKFCRTPFVFEAALPFLCAFVRVGLYGIYCLVMYPETRRIVKEAIVNGAIAFPGALTNAIQSAIDDIVMWILFWPLLLFFISHGGRFRFG